MVQTFTATKILYSKLGSTSTTAQAHPLHLTQALVESAQSRGVKVHIATASGLEFAADSKTPTAVVTTKQDGSQVSIPATDVVFAAGPWTGKLAKRLLGEGAGAAGTIVPRYATINTAHISTS